MSEADMEKPVKNGSPRLWPRIVLFASLALNLAVLGMAVGAFMRFGPPGDGRPVRADQVAGVYTYALAPEDRRRIGRAFFREHRDALPSREAMKSDFNAMVAALRAHPFEADTAAAILQRQLEFGQKRAELGHRLLLQHLSEMSDEDRSAYADRLEGALQKRFQGEHGRRPHGKAPDHRPEWHFMRRGD
ncbi:periplasmic heavy metal sensor [Thalassovita aquimarina]|uniref:Periplasmic heavy metal sensor n=1 Tax=Thalassovita aquimarina TaxID=2785917 RepID=A0ABS5HV64_9RHOB|nr:periplasmic heavy metal sensor [Thalassovita aquimarina]MBR9652866.1 periplasmic heavy metal sensor [Thalassovita aquimarina]